VLWKHQNSITFFRNVPITSLAMKIVNFYIRAFCLILVLSSWGCGTPMLKVQTTPDGAEVNLLRDDGAPTKLGTTPLSVTKDQTPELFKTNAEIRISKDGFETTSVLVPYGSFGVDTKVNLALTQAKLPSSCSNQDANLNEVGQKIAEAQRLIYKKDYVESRHILQTLAQQFPTVAIVYSLLGNGYYLEKNYPEALAAYRKALAITPNDKSITHIIEKLMPVTGDDRSNSSGGHP
jgi:tetratricopeptide (TPR) repeat protein